jgi:hypothetical protein
MRTLQGSRRLVLAFPIAVLAALVFRASGLSAGDVYKAVPGWGQQLPNGMKWGETSGMAIDTQGTILAFTRAEPPLIELNADGKVTRIWGDKMFVWPHGIRVDRDGNIWMTDGQNNPEKTNGQLVYKFTRDYKLLMTIGTKGEAGDGPYTFNGPTDVAVAANGDIFVTDGHVNARVVADACSWRTARTTASRSSTRMATFSISGRSSADRAASRSCRTIRCFLWTPITSRRW